MISIILVAYPEMKKLINVLDLIGNDLQIILVNNSENLSLDKFKFKIILQLLIQQIMEMVQLNLALEKITTKYAIYLDIDVEFKKDFIKNTSSKYN